MPGDFLDVILLVLCAAFAVAGYRQGFIIGVLSLAGFLAGVAIGAIVAPPISRALARSPDWQAIIVILVLFGAAVLGMLLASGIGVAVRSRVTGRPATFLDSLGGAAVNVVSVLLLAWLLGSLLINATSFPSVARQVNDSIVLKTVDRLMPGRILYPQLLSPLRGLLGGTGLYSQVFSAFGAESSVNLPPADPAVLDSAAVARIGRSVVKIVGVAPSCSLKIEGSGFVISPDHVLTNAHVVAGVGAPEVYADGQAYSGQVVFYDPNRDIAVLDVQGLDEPALQFAGPASYGANAIVAGYPYNHPLTLSPARVGESIEANGPNIYENAIVQRQIYAVRADVRPGNSGGPLLATDGRVYGVVFAASTSFADTGYALTAAEIASDVQAGEQATLPVSTGACQGS
ncbi:MAG TPA: MarP family serine protease [Streptosporangiaceae bacterium]|nr:MarP family serine protease [Streptosporangiaceae bacterium]